MDAFFKDMKHINHLWTSIFWGYLFNNTEKKFTKNITPTDVTKNVQLRWKSGTWTKTRRISHVWTDQISKILTELNIRGIQIWSTGFNVNKK